MKELFKWGKKTYIAAGALIVSTALILSAFSGNTQNGAQAGQSLYRESAVTRGDLTVGVTESTSATLKVHAVYFDFNLGTSSSGNNQNNPSIEIEEIFVKAGQRVKKGDPLVQLSSSDIQDAVNELQSDYQEALVSLTSAQLSCEKGQLEAKKAYDNTILNSQNADSAYDLTIEQLELAVKNAQKKVDDIKDEISTYTRLLRYFGSGDYDYYTDVREWYEESLERYNKYKDMLDQYETSADFQEGSTQHQQIIKNLEIYEEQLYYAEIEYNESKKNSYDAIYETDYEDEDEIEKDRDNARDRLEEAEASLRQAEYNLSVKTASAGQDRELTLSQAEIAELTYQLEISQLQNNVESKKLAASNIQDSMAKLQKYLDETTLVAPCDGLITSINCSAGDSLTSGTTMLNVSDSDNVFVYVNVAQDDILSIELGQQAAVSLDAFDTITFEGEVDGISTTPARSASGSASYSVTIKLMGDTAQVYEGMTGSATLITRQQKDVLYVSTRCVYIKDGQSYVKVKDENENIVEAPVTTGFSDGRNVEITEGLFEGQTVIIESQVNAG